MNILHIVQRYHPAIGGAELYMQYLSEYFAQNSNNTVYLLTTTAKHVEDLWKNRDESAVLMPEEMINRVHVLRCKLDMEVADNPFFKKIIKPIVKKCITVCNVQWLCINQYMLPHSREMARFIDKSDRLKFDIVHVSAMPFGFLFYAGLKISEMDGARFFMTPFLHLGDGSQHKHNNSFLLPYHIPFYIKADRIFVQTEHERHELIKFVAENSRVQIETQKVIKVGLGVDTFQYTMRNPQAFRSAHKLKYPIVFYVGRQTRGKGTMTLISAMDILWKSGERVHLVLAGEILEDVRRYLRHYRSKHWICQLGEIVEEEKQRLFSSGDIFVMISGSDSFGIVYLESWLYKKPVIACDSPVFREIIAERKDGLFSKLDDPVMLSARIRYLLHHQNIANEMGQNGYNKVKMHYSLAGRLKLLSTYYDYAQ